MKQVKQSTKRTTRKVSKAKALPKVEPYIEPSIIFKQANDSTIDGEFLKETKPSDDGANNHCVAFIQSLKNCFDNERTFDINTIRYYTRFREISAEETDALWIKYKATMLKYGRLKVLPAELSAYDTEQYTVI